MRVFGTGARLGAAGLCAIAVAGCDADTAIRGHACAASAFEAGVGLHYSGFSSKDVLTAEVCIARTCSTTAPTKGDSRSWVSPDIDSFAMRGVRTISVTVRDTSHRVVAQNPALPVRVVKVDLNECDVVRFGAGVAVTPGHAAAATARTPGVERPPG